MNLLKFIYREAEGSKLKMTTASFMSGMSRGMLLATINATAANTPPRATAPRSADPTPGTARSTHVRERRGP